MTDVLVKTMQGFGLLSSAGGPGALYLTGDRRCFVSEALSVVARPSLSLPEVEEEPHCKDTQRQVILSNGYAHASQYNRI